MNVTTTESLTDGVDLSQEMVADLGDPRRNQRLQLLVSALSRCPAASYPEQLRDPSQLEAFYRFVGNDHVEFDDVLEPHQLATVERAQAVGEVVVIHDTTDFGFPVYDGQLREGLCEFSRKRQGFLAHVSLVATADGFRCPLGVIRAQPFPYYSQLPDIRAKRFWKQHFGLMESEYDRWQAGIDETSALLANVSSVIHVTDREADAYDILTTSQERGSRYVIRLTHDRRIVEPGADGGCYIREHLDSLEPVAKRRIHLGARVEAPGSPRGRDAKTLRRERDATVEVRAASVQIKRPKNRPELKHLPRQFTVNIVRVTEPNPPKGEEPIEWTLATTEPIDTVDAVLHIIDIYRTRWLIEEYFKAIKSGCSYEKRQLESAHSLLIALAMTLPIAWRLLLLRHLGRSRQDLPASAVISEVQLAILRHAIPRWKWSRKPTARDTMLAIARLGGHLRNNGPPGWMTLGRGLTRLLEMERGWEAARRYDL